MMRLFLFFLGLNLVFGMDTENITNFRKTEGWLETDHFGSGYHLVPDYIKPNIWIKAFKYDGAVGDVAGLPITCWLEEIADLKRQSRQTPFQRVVDSMS